MMPGRTRVRFLQCSLVLLVLLGLSACGQKGDLYLPEDEQASDSTSNDNT